MELDDNEEGGQDELKQFKDKVLKILEDNKLDEKRSSKMEIVDFLSLLSIFNAEGIHFA